MSLIITGDAATTRTNLGLGTAATKATGTGANDVPLNSDLGTAAALNVGTSANDIVQLDGSGNLPALDGSALTGVGGGKVLQMWETSQSSQITTTSTSAVSTGFSITLTPNSSTSKLVGFYRANGGTTAPNQRFYLEWRRDGSAFNEGKTTFEVTSANSTETDQVINWAKPTNSTASTTFELFWFVQSGTGYLNRNAYGTLIIFEVEA
jgi:hypothetical protein